MCAPDCQEPPGCWSQVLILVSMLAVLCCRSLTGASCLEQALWYLESVSALWCMCASVTALLVDAHVHAHSHNKTIFVRNKVESSVHVVSVAVPLLLTCGFVFTAFAGLLSFSLFGASVPLSPDPHPSPFSLSTSCPSPTSPPPGPAR